MSRFLNILLFSGIVGFWLAMNMALIERQLDFRSMGPYHRGVVNFLGNELYRESWMGIYRDHKKIGYTGFIFTKNFGSEGIEHVTDIETRIIVDLFGKGNLLVIKGKVVADYRMLPETLDLDVEFSANRIKLEGRRDGDQFRVTGSSSGLKLIEKHFPLRELCVSGLLPKIPISGFEVGQHYRVPVFDPIFQVPTEATVEVKSRQSTFADGLRVDCFVLETHFRGMKYSSLVTLDGEVIKHTIPPPIGVTVKRESRKIVKKGMVERP